MIALIDYGAGNLTSVRKAMAAIDARLFTPRTPEEIGRAVAMVVPGVGHFDRTRAIDAAWRDAIGEAIGRGAPLLGICVGLQWLFEGSDEAPGVDGLGLFPGVCARLGNATAEDNRQTADGDAEVRLPPADSRLPKVLKVPHVGWNSLSFPRDSTIMSGIPDGSQVYFTHSYAAPVVEDTAALTTYGLPFTAAVERGQISGVQFHPEKSGEVGLRVLRNWLETL